MSNLKAVELNHAGAFGHSQQTSLWLLALGALCAASALILLYLAAERVRVAETEVGRLQQRSAPQLTERTHAPVNAQKQAEIAAVKAALAELAMPWETLFKTLEGLKLTGVRVVAIEPDAKQKKVRILAKAADTAVMLEYVDALEALLMLHDVFLLTHEFEPGNGELPVSFNVEASWVI